MSGKKRILIANRGEIAIRIAKAAQELGYEPVGIYSEADRNALHVRFIAECHFVGPSAASASYLNAPKIVRLAKELKCDAVHPGYGFLSENFEFASLVEQAGLIFIGPSAEHIRLLGDKLQALNVARQAGIPTLPSSTGKQSDETLIAFAKDHGFPFIIKAAAGGGGRGMRVVTSLEELRESLPLARGEAKKFFNDDTVYLERYLDSPRHIEVQVFGDGNGQGAHYFTRDCSVQRRHQKVIEEAPAPLLSNDVHDAICNSALALVKALSYRNAGTVEFLVTTDNQFYFLEINTRIQVEHPVTELITGVDLVQLQIRLAFTGTFPSSSLKPQLNGHAIELRLIAEDPTRNFAPATGALKQVQLSSQFTRIDAGYETGDEVSLYYDSLLAKLMIWAPNRALAIEKARQAVRDSQVLGIETNLSFFDWLFRQNDFLQGAIPITFLEKRLPDNFQSVIDASCKTFGDWVAPECGVLMEERFALGQGCVDSQSVTIRHLADGSFLAIPTDRNGSPLSRRFWRFSNCKHSLLRAMNGLAMHAN
jgi:acetyl-CoA carboxylase biotin carboxylase subunit